MWQAKVLRERARALVLSHTLSLSLSRTQVRACGIVVGEARRRADVLMLTSPHADLGGGGGSCRQRAGGGVAGAHLQAAHLEAAFSELFGHDDSNAMAAIRGNTMAIALPRLHSAMAALPCLSPSLLSLSLLRSLFLLSLEHKRWGWQALRCF